MAGEINFDIDSKMWIINLDSGRYMFDPQKTLSQHYEDYKSLIELKEFLQKLLDQLQDKLKIDPIEERYVT